MTNSEASLTEGAQGELDKYLRKMRSSLLAQITSLADTDRPQVTGRDIRHALIRRETLAARSRVVIIGFQLAVAVLSIIASILVFGTDRNAFIALSIFVTSAACVSALLTMERWWHAPDQDLAASPLRSVASPLRYRTRPKELELIMTVARIEEAVRMHHSQGLPSSKERVPLFAVLQGLVSSKIWSEKDLLMFRQILRTRNLIVHGERTKTPSDGLDRLLEQASDLLDRTSERQRRVKWVHQHVRTSGHPEAPTTTIEHRPGRPSISIGLRPHVNYSQQQLEETVR